jgi:hypothetical protein
MDNETSVNSDWGKYWADYIQKKAFLEGKKVYTTEMWDPWNLNHPLHLESIDNPEIFNFIDISQNNHELGDVHWNNALGVFARLQKMNNIRPVNNIKVYGHDGGKHKTSQDGMTNFVLNVLLGCASTRFHRPGSGLGLNDTAWHFIKSMREITQQEGFFDTQPGNKVLLERDTNEAYCRMKEGKLYFIYFPKGGEVGLKIADKQTNNTIRWLDILGSDWKKPTRLDNTGPLTIKAPDNKHWIAVIKQD